MINRYGAPLSGVMAVVEYDNRKKLTKLSYEVLGAAQYLAALVHEPVHAVLIGTGMDEAAADLAGYGIDRLILCRADTSDGHDIDSYVKALVYLADKYCPRYLLMPMSVTGREAAPRAAARLDAGIMADCMSVGRSDGSVTEPVFTRLSFGGYLSTDVCFRDRQMHVVTIRSGMFDRAVPDGHAGTILREEVPGVVQTSSGSKFLRQIQSAAEGILSVEDADVIVAGGRGAAGEKGFALIRELARLLGGAVGASRVAVDKGWIGHEALIGQSGKTVAPALYITCGIAGSIQHITGMRDSGCVVSINTDPKALIFDVSDYGIVGDMFIVLPVLIEEIQRIR